MTKFKIEIIIKKKDIKKGLHSYNITGECQKFSPTYSLVYHIHYSNNSYKKNDKDTLLIFLLCQNIQMSNPLFTFHILCFTLCVIKIKI